MISEIEYCREECPAANGQYSCWRARSMLHQAHHGGLSEENLAEHTALYLDDVTTETCLHPDIPVKVVHKKIYPNGDIPSRVKAAIDQLEERIHQQGEFNIDSEIPGNTKSSELR